ncbi:MAG: hypothetical protein JO097_09215 [Acidobacteriaceae bacterium]|nr:hypothetical protein [Acidobacteriaceae bacterium]MBV9296903.1 hypothetical protein [Acidobacteriaceae bacterium]MBV9764056.1 hypothetical protein [Acidobacteriaceae bacterium]
MSTNAQIAANKVNAQHSTGPKTEEGKAVSCLNNFRWGFCGAFNVLPSENAEVYDNLLLSLRLEHKPSTPTEAILVEKIAQHHWLSQRAMTLQNILLKDALLTPENEKQFQLLLRYQTTNDRAFHKCLSDLLKLRAEKRRAEIGFESQKRKEAEESRKQASEKRKQDLHLTKIRLAEANADRQFPPSHDLKGSGPSVSSLKNRFGATEQAA